MRRRTPAAGKQKATPSSSLWNDKIQPEQWAVYREVIQTARARGIRFALGGGLGLAYYTGHCRDTKDLDLYVTPDDKDRMIQAGADCGLTDYFDVKPYQRHWIFRAYKDDTIVDVIWSMPNDRALVDDQWLTRGPEVEIHGEKVRVLPAEELIWAKLYVLQRDRCDWGDILNILHGSGEAIDWDHLLWRLNDDYSLLRAVLVVFEWLAPEKASVVPANVLEKMEILPAASPVVPRANLLDTRPWFRPSLEQSIAA